MRTRARAWRDHRTMSVHKRQIEYNITVKVNFTLPEILFDQYESAYKLNQETETELYRRIKAYEIILERYLLTLKHIDKVDAHFAGLEDMK
jgi:hypothetical protein